MSAPATVGRAGGSRLAWSANAIRRSLSNSSALRTAAAARPASSVSSGRLSADSSRSESVVVTRDTVPRTVPAAISGRTTSEVGASASSTAR